MSRPSFYDEIATEYDRMYDDPHCQAENDVIGALLHRLGAWDSLNASVLDLGCGTGLFLDLMRERYGWLAPSMYTGFDLSARMLEVARQKHPSYLHSFMCADMLGAPPFGPFTHVVSLFAGYYVDRRLLAERIRYLLSAGGTYFLTLPTRRKAAAQNATWALDKRYGVSTYWYTPRMVRALYGDSAHVRGLSYWAKRLPGAVGTGLEFNTIGRLWPGGGDYLVVWGTVNA